VRVDRLWLTDFRNYGAVELAPAPGLTVVHGRNGHGKTNLLEAIAYLATLDSFRGAPVDALVRTGAERAVVRAEAVRGDRALLIEAEIVPSGRNRVQVNRQPLKRARDLLGALRVTVFSPDDLELVKGGPASRRGYLDETLVAAHPPHDALRRDVDRVLRQRNALLKQAGGRLDTDATSTLDVWDAKLAAAGDALGRARQTLVGDVLPTLQQAYDDVAEEPSRVVVRYEPAWLTGTGGLAAALEQARADDVRRGVSLVGPHRDELDIEIDGRPARTHASQGEQRALALALRLAAHRLVTEAAGAPPVLLLDDVFSELDPQRSAALVAHLPPGQTLLSSAGPLPPGAQPDAVFEIHEGTVVARGS
jgi:DNA replication and repair protein RecF